MLTTPNPFGFETNMLAYFTPGDVFPVGGREFVLSESRTLDIPFGADIYDIVWPPFRLP